MTTVRADVAELLRAGYGTKTIARRLNLTNTTVKRAREALGLPAGRSGPKTYGTPEDAFWQRTRPLDDGHLAWTGTLNNKRQPTLRHGGKRYSAHRIAFSIAHQRAPEGYVRPGCGIPGCVQPRHMEDRAIRQQLDTQYAAIFGEAA